MTDTNTETVAAMPQVVADNHLIEQLQQRVGDLEQRNAQLNDNYAEAVRNLVAAREQADRIQREFEQFKESITERMQREADRRNWCGEFDDIMEEFGLRRRSRNWDVTFEVTGHVSMTLIARNAEHAERIAWNALQMNTDNTYQVGRHGQHTLRISDVSCDEVEESET